MQKKIAPLIEECTETVEEVKLPNIIFAENENENSYECIPSTVHSEIAAYYVYSQWHSKKDSPHVDFNTHKETTNW